MNNPRFRSRIATLMGSPRAQRWLRVLTWAALAVYFALGLLVLVLRHFVLPGVGQYRTDIEREVSAALGRPVAIQAIDAEWYRLWPRLHIHGFEIRDADGRPALGFDDIDVDVAWSSLWHFEPRFARVEIDAPRLDLRRDVEGRIFVAGLEIDAENSGGGGFVDWLSVQDRIVVRDATITWNDELRRAPPLALSHLNFDLRNRGKRHRFGLTAEPPPGLAARIDLRGDFRGDDLESMATWKGQVYAELDYANLAGWRAWVDYPLDMPRGQGGMRLWLDFDHLQLTGATADVRLGRTTLRLGRDLPMLDMESMAGRLIVSKVADEFKLQARRLALATRQGLRVEPMDLDLRWRPASGTQAAQGELSASQLNVGALAGLAAYLPMDKKTRATLAAYDPKGRLSEVQVNWVGDAESLSAYKLQARFDELGLRAHGILPGFSGLDGRVEGDEKHGRLELAAQNATVDLPTVFEASQVELAELNASVTWKTSNGGVEVDLQQARFRNDDAAGEASGTYLGDGNGPGTIDLNAKLTQAGGGAVWRYMPLVVGQDVRHWLRDSIGGGLASATLRLKGDLQRFPFADGSGIFEVKGPFQGASLKYAPDWPPFEQVTGDLLFSGPRMLISAQRAKLWNVQLSDVQAEIADLEKDVPLVVTGNARGPTADFLRFIDASPVAGFVDHVTTGMKATGDGELKLRLQLPLHDLTKTQVEGRYTVRDNELIYFDGLPAASNLNGELHFTENGLEARKLRAVMLGAPVSADVTTEEGRVQLRATGSASIAALRQQYPQPLFDRATGTAPWAASVRVKKRTVEVRVDSSLEGVATTLPPPFGKSAETALPLALIFRPVDTRQQFEVTLGDVARADIWRLETGGIEKGMVAVGRRDAVLPAKGLLLAVGADHLDVDAWRSLAEGGGGTGSAGLPVDQVDVRANDLVLLGRPIHQVRLTGAHQGNTWKADIDSREAAGHLEWTGGNVAGHLAGHLSHLDIPDNGTTAVDQPPEPERTEQLPSVDVTVDRFMFHGRDFGQLKLAAENAAGVWNTRFSINSTDGDLKGTGKWQMRQPSVPASTSLDFNIETDNIENFLGRLGYPEAVRRGSATLDGSLSWAGAPTSFDFASLGGQLTLKARRGQFKKLEPGVGRLLGILSLQSLPRRITLDFRDIFSEGFAFDSIDGSVAIKQGVMETSDLEIDGPAALVLMNGQVDLRQETQDLKVRVQPTIGETVATGVLFINPVMGATAWLMNKLFGNPLDKVFAFDYAVTGSWSDPKVEKIAVQGPGVAVPSDYVTP